MLALLQLPIEIQLAIGGFLDYQSLRRLSSASVHFRRLFREDYKEVLNNVVFDTTDSGTHVVNSIVAGGPQKILLPCYGCFRFLTKLYYTADQVKRSLSRGTKHDSVRRCVTCQCKTGSQRFDFTGPSRSVTGYPGLRVYCAGCKYVIRMFRCDCGAFNHQSHLPSDGPKSKVPRNFRCYYCSERVNLKRQKRPRIYRDGDDEDDGDQDAAAESNQTP